jgi:hypothetical protein
MDEQLTQAHHSATSAADHLRRALADSDAVAALVLMPMIGDAARLAQQIAALIAARADRG